MIQCAELRRIWQASGVLLIAALGSAGMLFNAPAAADSVPLWGSKTSVPVDMPISQLKNGDFLWMAKAVSAGPLIMIVSLTEQKAYVYRNGVLIGATTVSTGRPGHATPTGVFTVLQKQKEHRSSIYDGAQMPYMQRLTWGGVALHAGGLPGYPESHGCIHLPSAFARELYAISPAGMTVVIANDATQPERVTHPGYLSPVNVRSGKPSDRDPLETTQDERWQPELSESGPISIVLSQASLRVVVYRNGIEIGRARIAVSGNAPLANHALVLAEGPSVGPDPFVPNAAQYRWLRIGIPGHMAEAGTAADPNAIARISIPREFVNHVNSVLTPGATVLVTDEAVTRQSGGSVEVLDADPPAATSASPTQGVK